MNAYGKKFERAEIYPSNSCTIVFLLSAAAILLTACGGGGGGGGGGGNSNVTCDNTVIFLDASTSFPYSPPPPNPVSPSPPSNPIGNSSLYYTHREDRTPNFCGTEFSKDGLFYNSIGSLSAVSTADFNNDGLDDLVYGGPVFPFFNARVPIKILFNNGSGKYIDGTSSIIQGPIPSPVHAQRAIAEDFNGDGIQDVFIANGGVDISPWPGELNTLLLSNIEGKLVESPANIHNIDAFSHDATAGDIDNDGDMDIYVANVFGLTMEEGYFLINDGTGSFTVRRDILPAFVTCCGAPFFPIAKISDMDNDNNLDLVLGKSNGEIIIIWGDGTGDFSSSPFSTLPTLDPYNLPNALLSVDVDNDNDNDLLVSRSQNFVGRQIQIFINNASRTFVDETSTRIPVQSETADWIENLVEIDFNNDGAADFLLQHGGLTAPGFNSIYAELIFINDGTGNFSPISNSVLANVTGEFVPIDSHGDGGLDFVVSNVPTFFQLDKEANIPGFHDFSLLVQEAPFP